MTLKRLSLLLLGTALAACSADTSTEPAKPAPKIAEQPALDVQLASTGDYAADWSQLDAREFPAWWTDAKFGIFIHWGPYSVPAYTTPGEYSEWYWERIGTPNTDDTDPKTAKLRDDMVAFHREHYGDAPYFDFAEDFTADFFDAEQWADIFSDAGAKYVVMVSKHHDGFALWPSEEASRTWGRPWNSVEIGPKRDLVGELAEATRDEDLKFGLYYSIYEWFNPLYKKDDIEPFLRDHYVPQFKDMVNRYDPEVIFMDGEWDFDSDVWKSEELLSWVYNTSDVADSVVVNDRWGAESRHVHGGYYTTEYGAGLPNSDHPWEENRGLGFSFGFNRAENLEHYQTGQQLVLTLIDTVSRGGNLLLNVGPTADGRIPVIMQDRLAYMGDWLEVNGEAIYGTTTFGPGHQWSADGKPQIIDTSKNYRAKYDIIEQTLTPPAGAAVKEALFTRKGNTLYAITPTYPTGQLRLRDMNMPSGARVSMLGQGGTLDWRQVGGDVVIDVPDICVDTLPFAGAYTFKIDGALR